jgi:hypothetical protein
MGADVVSLWIWRLLAGLKTRCELPTLKQDLRPL